MPLSTIWLTQRSAVVAVLAFVRRTGYTRRLDIRAAVEPIVRRNFPAHFRRALNHALATAR